ncbi:DUF3192 domain-containing protein [Aestuariibacter sp. AA17]|uniref:DUF3192 domain-containing protein n=1 Tax=Fluctibacter corallii TaxID=2984329 RepID=A0ABT3A3K6_9ALTE|nr:DUF3192 domain-containing protein [Aestuariibacter sp. AA17]MCV2883260.1 DUF3192 domain-containing protein [Aestuariibacter sp. AA17]
MKKLLLAAAVSAPLLLSGCVVSVGGDDDYDSYSHSSWQKKERKNRAHIASLELGMSVESVKNKMGVPDFNEMYNKQDRSVQVLFYRTQRAEGDGATTKDECTPLVFKGGALVGWGERAYLEM